MSLPRAPRMSAARVTWQLWNCHWIPTSQWGLLLKLYFDKEATYLSVVVRKYSDCNRQKHWESCWHNLPSPKCQMMLQWPFPLPSLPSLPGFEDSSLLWSDALCSLHCLSPAGTTTHHAQSWLREAEKKARACLLTSRPWWCTGVHGELALIWGWLTKID